jgi:hypothetical protein
MVWSNGLREWFRSGKLHREGDQPAVILPDGSRLWYREGELHRDGDRPAVIGADGLEGIWKRDKKCK